MSSLAARVSAASCALALGCAAGEMLPAKPSAPSTPAQATSRVAPASSAISAAAPSASSSPLPLEPAPKLALALVRVLTVPVRSIALGEGTRVAVLADPPQAGDARGFKALPLPLSLRAAASAEDRTRIFFGRDNEPRIMGARLTNGAETAIYWRHTSAGWRDGREEIGQLGGTLHGGLWGVLGGDDPELVCRSNALCIIKRSTGWQTAPAGNSARVVNLQDGVLWGLDVNGIAGIDAQGWALAIAAPAWSEPAAFWATQDEAWVSSKRELFHFHNGAWSTLPSPIAEVTAWWGARADSVWLVGEGGLAHFDGQRFSVARIDGPLRAIRGRNDGEVWFGGDAGLFRAGLVNP